MKGTSSESLLDRWISVFTPGDELLAVWVDVFPKWLDDRTPEEVTLEDMTTNAMRNKSSTMRPADAFRHYLAAGECAAAQKALDIFGEQSIGENCRRDIEDTIDLLTVEYNEGCSRLEAWMYQLRMLETEAAEQTVEALRLEADRLKDINRWGRAVSILHQATDVVESRVRAVMDKIQDKVQTLALQTNLHANIDVRVSVGRLLDLARQFLNEEDVRLAYENCSQAERILSGLTSPELPVTNNVRAYRDPGDFPNIDLGDVLLWMKGERPQRSDPDHWENFLTQWALPELRGLDSIVFRILSELQSVKGVRRPDFRRADVDNPWRHFLRLFFAALGVGPTMAPDGLTPLSGTNDQIIAWGECSERLQWQGSFLNEEKLPRGLLVLAWQSPQDLRYPPGAFVPSLKENGLFSRIGIVMSPHVVPAAIATKLADALPKLALLDERSILKIVFAHDESERMDRFVAEIAQQVDFEAISPFQQERPVQNTMFFGRTEELERLARPNGPAIVYGGRKVGKSSLLTELERRFEGEGRGYHVAIYLNEPTAGTAPGTIGAVLHRILQKLCVMPENKRWINSPDGKSFGGFSQFITPTEDARAFVDKLRNLCTAFPKHRFLILFDEADAFIESLTYHEARVREKVIASTESSVGGLLRGLIQEAPSRIGFIFAGFQEIHRAASDPRSPFFNLRGEAPLQLSALQDGEARVLVERSLSLLGLRFEKAYLVDRVLLYSGCHPSILQEFCARVFRRVRRLNKHAPFIIMKRDVDQVFQDPQFREQVFNVIHLNVVDRDTRPKRLLRLVLYVWVHRLYRPIGTELTLQTVYPSELHAHMQYVLGKDEVEEILRLGELKAYLHDLQVLGVLRSTNDGGYYLANRYFASLVREFKNNDTLASEIEHLWLNLAEQAAKRPRTWVRSARRGWTLSPMTPEDEDIWNLSSHKVTLLIGSSQMGKSLAIGWLGNGLLDGGLREVTWKGLHLPGPAGERVRKAITGRSNSSSTAFARAAKEWWAASSRPDLPAVLVIEDVDNLAAGDSLFKPPDKGSVPWLGELVTQSTGRLRVIVSGGIGLARFWVRHRTALEKNVEVLPIRRFDQHESERDRWFLANSIVAADHVRERIWIVTGGDPRLLEAFRRSVGDAKDQELTVTDVAVEQFLSRARTAGDLPWQKWLRQAVAGVPPLARGALTILGRWSREWGREITEDWLDLLCNPDGLKGHTDGLPLALVNEIATWSTERWVEEIKALTLLDELQASPPHASSSGPRPLAIVRQDDLWFSLVTAGGEP